uniref:Legume lectin domain-containing protein n=1 Tax=Aureoumbra lagunensis TaxID=44058 RepID=A0A7S3K491_9STRA|mmetsp:Transcript_11834/g.17714  ORF Transcript_11834/g.17714 Transcript_11834/m.17714 type:complete len:451 (+) Transcript_11834:31-1383(+)
MLSFVLLTLLLRRIDGDWVYADFNTTQGLILNGDAVWTDCNEDLSHRLDDVYSEDTEASATRVVETSDGEGSLFSHRDSIVNEKKSFCPGRIRLTPGKSDKRGSMWYRLATPIGLGFETIFSFKVSSQSKHCTKVRDLAFSLNMYESCYVHGGDGLAFVIQLDPNTTSAIGQGGAQLGYGGITKSLALEFDMNYNPPLNPSTEPLKGDQVPNDHLELRSRGKLPNSANEPDALLAPLAILPHGADLADGQEHIVKVVYKPYIDLHYFKNFSVTKNAAKYMLDAGENRRLGILLVWIDQGLNTDIPSIAIPINLPLLLSLPGDSRAFLGFTAATGLKWQNHDLLSWYVCDRPDCEAHPSSKERNIFIDYHTSSNIDGPYKRFQLSPGAGYGYGGSHTLHRDTPEMARDQPTKHTSPQATVPLGPGHSHYAPNRNKGLIPDAASQVPPHTVF